MSIGSLLTALAVDILGEHNADGTHKVVALTTMGHPSGTYGHSLIDPIVGEGWWSAAQTWTYASATTFTVSGDVTAKYTIGTKLRLKQGGAYKYFYVIGATYSAPNTTVTVTGGSDYSLANAAITDGYLSYAETPQG